MGPPLPRDLCSVLVLFLLNLYLAHRADSLAPAMVEGDMAVPQQREGQEGGIQHSFVLSNDSLWFGGLVPFRFEKLELTVGVFEDLFRDEDMDLIRSVLEAITQAVPCIKFREVPDDYAEHCLIFTVLGDNHHSAQGCWSFVGNVGPQGGKTGQAINLGGSGCLTKGIVLHEVLHALGATHKQNREDRNLFVNIHEENIAEEYKSNFERKTEGFNSRGTPYDDASIMHYQTTDFSKNGKSTITPIRSDITLRPRHDMSPIDVMELSRVYEGITSSNCVSNDTPQKYVKQLENQMEKELILRIWPVYQAMEQQNVSMIKEVGVAYQTEMVRLNAIIEPILENSKEKDTLMEALYIKVKKCKGAFCILPFGFA